MTSPEREAAVRRIAEKMREEYSKQRGGEMAAMCARIAAEEIERAVLAERWRAHSAQYGVSHPSTLPKWQRDIELPWAQVCPEE